MPLFFSLCAVVIDGTNLMVNKRQLQNAADAAVLAAAQELPTGGTPCPGPDTDPTTCLGRMRRQAEGYSLANGGPSSLPACADSTSRNCYVSPYKGSTGSVEIRVRGSVSGFFTNLIGIFGSGFNVSARA